MQGAGNDSRIPPGAGLGQLLPIGQEGGVVPPLDVADHPLPPVAGGAEQPIAAGPTETDFTRIDRLADFVLSPEDEAPAAERGAELAEALEAPAPLPPPRSPLEESRLEATRIFCQQLIGNHAVTQHFLNPGPDSGGLIRKAMSLDFERRLLIIDSLVDIVRSGRDQAAAANIVNEIQGLALCYLYPEATEDHLDSADRILPRLIQRVKELDVAPLNNSPLWLRLVAIANLFGRPMRGLPSTVANAQRLRAGVGENPLVTTDAFFAAALAVFDPEDVDNFPLARAIRAAPAEEPEENDEDIDGDGHRAEPTAEELKARFRRLAYGRDRDDSRWRISRALVSAYPDSLYTIDNYQRYCYYMDRDRLSANHILRGLNDRYFLTDPDVAALIRIIGVVELYLALAVADSTRESRQRIWSLFKTKLEVLKNHPHPEVREATKQAMLIIARDGTDPEIVAEARDLLTATERFIFVSDTVIGRGTSEPYFSPFAKKATKVANYVTGAPGFVVGGLLGLVGGAIVGFFKGLAKGQNPFQTAAVTARNAAIDCAVYGSYVLGGFIGASIVSAIPADTRKFLPLPVTAICTYLFSRPGKIVGKIVGAVAGGLVGFFRGLFTGQNPFKVAAHDMDIVSGKVGNVCSVLLGGWVGAVAGFVVDLALLVFIALPILGVAWLIDRRR